MQNRIRNNVLLFFCLFFLFMCSGCAKEPDMLLSYDRSLAVLPEEESYELPELMAEHLAVFDVSSEEDTLFSDVTAALLVDDTNGEPLYGKNVYERCYPASITKIATAYMALKYGNLEDTVTVSYEASHIAEPGAKLCRFQEGDQINLKDLLCVMLVYSGNDAAMAVAEHIGGTEKAFCEQMNQELAALGASHTHFTNSHGLHDKEHYTTAYDIYLIFQELAENETFRDMIQNSSVSLTYKDKGGAEHTRTFETTNRYLLSTVSSPKSFVVYGGKTGTTNAAGNCLVLLSERKDGSYFISVILHAKNPEQLYQNMTKLIELAAS